MLCICAWPIESFAESVEPLLNADKAQKLNQTATLEHQPKLKLSPDILGLRAIYGRSHLSEEEAMTLSPTHSQTEDLYGSAVSVEWVMLNHHLELELIFGFYKHNGLLDEFGELVFKVPYHINHQVELLFGFGTLVETYDQHPEFGITGDINFRYWMNKHWGLSAEYDYLRFISGTESQEWIAEVLYRF